MSFLRQAWFVASRDTGLMLRQWETVIWTFAMPLLFFYFIGTVTAGFGPGPDADRPDPLALVAPADAGFLADELERRLAAEHFAVTRGAPSPELEAYARRLHLPDPPPGHADFTAAVLAGEQAVLRYERRGDGLGAELEQVRLLRAVYGVLADLVVTTEDGAEPGPAAFAELAAMPRALSVRSRPAGERPTIPRGFEQTIPGTMVMFTMLILLTSGSILLVIERRQGLLRRLASTPIPRGAVVLGKWTSRMLLGLIQIGFAVLAGTVLFGMRWGDSLPMVLAILVAWGAFNASLGLLLGNLARSEAQMTGLGVLASLILAALGGCWWPIEIAPPWMQSLALALPTGWAMDAMHLLVSFGRGSASALPHLAALAGGALVLGWLAARSFRYQ